MILFCVFSMVVDGDSIRIVSGRVDPWGSLPRDEASQSPYACSTPRQIGTRHKVSTKVLAKRLRPPR